MNDALQHAVDIFMAGVRGVQPDRILAATEWQTLADRRLPAYRNVHVLAIGKSALAMASVVDSVLAGKPGQQLIVVPRGYPASLPPAYHVPEGAQVIEAGHPISDHGSLKAGARTLEIAEGAGADDLVLVLLSGGGSALCVSLAPGIQLDDARQMMRLLLESGADIRAVNTVRKHLSTISGGQLARAAFPAEVITLLISDVPGDDLSVIASGPTVADESTFADAWSILERYDLMARVPASIRRHLEAGLAGTVPETAKPGDSLLERAKSRIIGSNQRALEAARQEAQRLGYGAYVSTELIHGEAREVGKRLAREALEIKGEQPVCLIWGGETTVTVRGKGLGGRNQEVALGAALALENSRRNIVFLSAGTDGRDGPSPAAGAVVSASTMASARAAELLPEQYLATNDSYHFFERAGGLVVTGPTHTNVMDLQLAIVLPG